jgi:hypothetical protein
MRRRKWLLAGFGTFLVVLITVASQIGQNCTTPTQPFLHWLKPPAFRGFHGQCGAEPDVTNVAEKALKQGGR